MQIPVRLRETLDINYEMACDDRWVEYARKKEKDGKCEIGMHIHAWNSPPDYKLNMLYPGNPYITEYPDEIIDQKVKSLKDFLENRFESPVFRVLLCMDGCGTISYDEGTVNFYKGDCVFVPADSEVLTIHGQAQFLDIRG